MDFDSRRVAVFASGSGRLVISAAAMLQEAARSAAIVPGGLAYRDSTPEYANETSGGNFRSSRRHRTAHEALQRISRHGTSSE
jgi:hypothetical protein